MLNLEQFKEDVRSGFQAGYFVNGKAVKGVTISDLKSSLHGGNRGSFSVDRRYKNLGTLYEFQQFVEEQGFAVEHGKNSRGQNCVVVFDATVADIFASRNKETV